MSLEQRSNGSSLIVQEIEGVLRYADGSVDIAAYAKQAHRERAAAIATLAREALRMVREMLSGVRASLAPVARSAPASGKRHAPVGK